MKRLTDLSRRVQTLYEEKLKSRSPWSDWMYPHHVLVVASSARQLATQLGADDELTQVAAPLHDIAYTKMTSSSPNYDEECSAMARQIMIDCGYSEKEVALVVDDAIRYHSCKGNERPKSKEGLVLAAADSMAHLQTDFYIFATWELGKRETLEEVKEWVLAKIERDFHNKISFDDIRENVRPDYEMIKNLYSR